MTYVYFVRGAQHAALCRTSIESVRRVDPQAVIWVMTDEDHATKGWHIDGCAYIQPGLPIMLANLEAQVAALFLCRPEEPIVFLDTDILLLQKLPALSDLTITWRDHVGMKDEEKIEGVAGQMPYNYGVMIAQHSAATVEAFIWMRERIRKMSKQYQHWYGNQLALAELAGPRPDKGTMTSLRKIPWLITSAGKSISISRVPAEHYNYTPQRVGEDISNKFALHFKGGARALMESYAARLGLTWKAAA